jgi:hypothetical protein
MKGPLAGLSRKHFVQGNFLAHNMLQEIEREGVGIIFRKLTEHYGHRNYIGKSFDEIDLSLIPKALFETLDRRAARRAKSRDGGLTGEHLIYANLPTGNIYLYASFHGENPQRIAECVAVSFQDFPELAGIAPVFG